MAIPAFDHGGELPPGVHCATLDEALGRFGGGSNQRQAVALRLKRIYELTTSTGQLARFVVFGSFVTAKQDPNDVDIIIIMEDTFDLGSASRELTLLFQHLEAEVHFGASVFWCFRSSALGGEDAMVEYWQIRREGGLRGIVEIVGE